MKKFFARLESRGQFTNPRFRFAQGLLTVTNLGIQAFFLACVDYHHRNNQYPPFLQNIKFLPFTNDNSGQEEEITLKQTKNF